MTVSYATDADLTAWLPAGTVVADAARLLLRASEVVDAAVRAPFTVVTATQLPVDSTVAAALRDATCAQVEQWVEVGEENDIDGLAGRPVQIGGLSSDRAPELAPRAHRILLNAGLLTLNPDARLHQQWVNG